MGCRMGAGTLRPSPCPQAVTPAQAGVSRGKDTALSLGNPSLRWSDVRGEVATTTPNRIPAQAGIQSPTERRSRTTTLAPRLRGGTDRATPYPPRTPAKAGVQSGGRQRVSGNCAVTGPRPPPGYDRTQVATKQQAVPPRRRGSRAASGGVRGSGSPPLRGYGLFGVRLTMDRPPSVRHPGLDPGSRFISSGREEARPRVNPGVTLG